MTRKEKLAKVYLELKKNVEGENFLAGARVNQIWYLTKEFKVIDLQAKIEVMRCALAHKEKRLEKEAWYETEEGKAFKQQNEEARLHIYEEQKELRENALQHTRKVVKALLGEEFDVITFSSGSMEIGIIEEYREDGMLKGLFGHDFDVCFDKEWFNNGYKWEMNYGTLGSFNIEEDKKRTAFLIGMAKFASDTRMVPVLKEYLHEFVKKHNALSEEGYKLKAEFDNPPMTKA